MPLATQVTGDVVEVRSDENAAWYTASVIDVDSQNNFVVRMHDSADKLATVSWTVIREKRASASGTLFNTCQDVEVQTKRKGDDPDGWLDGQIVGFVVQQGCIAGAVTGFVLGVLFGSFFAVLFYFLFGEVVAIVVGILVALPTGVLAGLIKAKLRIRTYRVSVTAPGPKDLEAAKKDTRRMSLTDRMRAKTSRVRRSGIQNNEREPHFEEVGVEKLRRRYSKKLDAPLLVKAMCPFPAGLLKWVEEEPDCMKAEARNPAVARVFSDLEASCVVVIGSRTAVWNGHIRILKAIRAEARDLERGGKLTHEVVAEMEETIKRLEQNKDGGKLSLDVSEVQLVEKQKGLGEELTEPPEELQDEEYRKKMQKLRDSEKTSMCGQILWAFCEVLRTARLPV